MRKDLNLAVWCELVCYRCADTTAGISVTMSNIPRGWMMKEAEKKGWKIDQTGCICSSCQKRVAQ